MNHDYNTYIDFDLRSNNMISRAKQRRKILALVSPVLDLCVCIADGLMFFVSMKIG